MSCILVARDLQRLDLPCVAAGCVVLACGILLLVPKLGLLGAAVSALGGAAVQCIIRGTLLQVCAGVQIVSRQFIASAVFGVFSISIIAFFSFYPNLSYLLALCSFLLLIPLVPMVSRIDISTLRGLL
jgi:hypothetical protein